MCVLLTKGFYFVIVLYCISRFGSKSDGVKSASVSYWLNWLVLSLVRTPCCN